MDLGAWLRGLGLERYEAAFRENEIDETVLPDLTHETLKELGVASFGHRVKLLDAIAALCADESGKAPSADAAPPSTAPSASMLAAEWRVNLAYSTCGVCFSQLQLQSPEAEAERS